MPKILYLNICRLFFVFFCYSSVFAQSPKISYEDLKRKYVPQETPEATFRLELELLSQGIYCYDLSFFDSQWRVKKGKEIIYSSVYKNTAEKFDTSLQTYKEGKYAVIYFPRNKNLGPVFLYRDSLGWIIHRTAIWDYIHYNYSNSGWFAYDGDYPYLDILRKIFRLEKVKLDTGVWAYQIKE